MSNKVGPRREAIRPLNRLRQPGEVLDRQWLVEAELHAQGVHRLLRHGNIRVDIGVDRIARLRICPVHSDLVIPQHHFAGYEFATSHRGRPMILELDEDETAI